MRRIKIARKNIKRITKLAARAESAKHSIGKICSGIEFFGFTKGQFSLIDIMTATIEIPQNPHRSSWRINKQKS